MGVNGALRIGVYEWYMPIPNTGRARQGLRVGLIRAC